MEDILQNTSDFRGRSCNSTKENTTGQNAAVCTCCCKSNTTKALSCMARCLKKISETCITSRSQLQHRMSLVSNWTLKLLLHQVCLHKNVIVICLLPFTVTCTSYSYLDKIKSKENSKDVKNIKNYEHLPKHPVNCFSVKIIAIISITTFSVESAIKISSVFTITFKTEGTEKQ
nr:PREDICTED: uncharacterized protein LOC103278502 isoform X3 [Anolis carolinensis]|eukprot:XP_016848328.1 PREDICTED: uncharacterized protein LOC103278502 isoform X3 [Anolis carolinensis]